MRDILLEAAENETSDNPFVLHSLIIDDCWMKDHIFAIILEGVYAQSSLKALHYTNGNEIGELSEQYLVKICSREKQSSFLHEVNISNNKIIPVKGKLNHLVSIT